MSGGPATSTERLGPAPPAAGGAARFSGWIRHWRDGWLSNPAFQRWAATFPLTRGIARRRARALFDLCAGFVYSQVLLACVRLRLFDVLADGPLTVAALGARLGLGSEATLRLVRAGAALGLVETRPGDAYGLGPLGVVMPGNPALTALVEHHALVYGDLADPVALLRGAPASRLAAYWPYVGASRPAALDAAATRDYTALMAASQALIADDVLDAYPLGRHRCLLDVGGGSGLFAAAAAARAPGLQVAVFDLPVVAELAAARFAAAGLGPRARAHGGDFLADPLPAGADLVCLVRVLHDHDDAAAARLLAAIRAALAPGGRLLIAEPLAGAAGAGPVGDAYLGFYLLALGAGRPRTEAEVGRLLADAGFGRPQRIPTRRPLHTGLLVAAARDH